MNKNINVPELRFSEFSDKWEEKKIGDILNIGSGKDYKHLGKGNIPVYGTGGYMLSVDKHLYEGESVGIGRKGTIDKPVFLNGKFWTVDTLFYTHSFKNVLPKFVYLIFQNINWKYYNEASGVPSLSKTTIENIKKNIPSILEQKKIADFLTSVDKKIEQLTKKKSLLEKYKKGVMQQIFNQEIRFKDDNGNDFPDWEEKLLGDVLKIIDGDRGKNYPNGNDFVNNGYCLFLNTKNVTNKGFSFEEKIFITREKDEKLKKGKLKINDLILTTRGSVGNIAYFDENIPFKNLRINSGMVIIRNENNNISSDYIYKLFSSFVIKNQISSISFGSAQPQLTVKEINKIFILLPSLKEQKKIADFLTSIDKKIDLVSFELEKIQLWKKGLLQKIFI